MTAMKTKRIGRPRSPAIDAVTGHTALGTREIVEAIVKESGAIPAWRPVRASAVLAMAAAAAPKDHVWMTCEEFAAFADRFFPLQKAGGGVKPLAKHIGVAMKRRRAIIAGEPVRKIEALACAHYAAGLPLPIAPGDVRAFHEWFHGVFGAARAVGIALGISHGYIPERLAGYELAGGARRARSPDEQLIRALDWMRRMGAVSPYGDRLGVPAWPGQAEGTF
jgi:hypothetical protein